MALAGGCALGLHTNRLQAAFPFAQGLVIVNLNDPSTKVRLAKLYLGRPNTDRPATHTTLQEARQQYEREWARQARDLTGIDFVINELISQPEQIPQLLERLGQAEGILAIPLTAGATDLVRALAASQRPVQLMTTPEVEQEQAAWDDLLREPSGAGMDQYRINDVAQLAGTVRPFRAIHRLHEATIANLNLRPVSPEYQREMAGKYGTQLKTIGYQRLGEAYASIDSVLAEVERLRWLPATGNGIALSEEEMAKSCRMALALNKVMAEESATMMATGCFGALLPASAGSPCIGSVRLRPTALGGHSESYLTSALLVLLWQELSDLPVYLSDFTVDSATGTVVLNRCRAAIPMVEPKQTGPTELSPVKAESWSGFGPQVGQTVTQAVFLDSQQVVYFTGEVVAAADTRHNYRAQLALKVNGGVATLSQSGYPGVHGVLGNGDLAAELERFCRWKGLRLVNAAGAPSLL